MVDWRINQLLQAKPKPAGTREDFARTKINIFSALVRLANRQRSERGAVLDSLGRNINKHVKAGKANWILKKKGTTFYRHYNEVDNENDPYVKDYVDNALVTGDEEFIAIVNEAAAKVRDFFLNFFVKKNWTLCI